MLADSILTHGVPFLGDKQYDSSKLIPELWFRVSLRARTNDYVVDDMLVGEHIMIAHSHLKDPDFDISHWYAEQRMQVLGLTKTIRHHHCIGDAVATVAAKLLTDGIPSSYPCTD